MKNTLLLKSVNLYQTVNVKLIGMGRKVCFLFVLSIFTTIVGCRAQAPVTCSTTVGQWAQIRFSKLLCGYHPEQSDSVYIYFKVDEDGSFKLDNVSCEQEHLADDVYRAIVHSELQAPQGQPGQYRLKVYFKNRECDN